MVRTLFTPIKGGMVRLGHVPPQLLEIHYNRDIGSLVVDAATSRSSSFQIDVLLVTWWIKVFVCLPFRTSIAPGIRPYVFSSSGLNGSPFPIVKFTCSNLPQVGEGEFDYSILDKKPQHSLNIL